MITRKNWGWWLLGLALFEIGATVPLKVIGAVAAILAYLISLRIHPHRDCRKCGGTGRHRGWLFGFSHRPCSECGGQSRHRRTGNVILSRSKPVLAERRADAAGQRRNRPLP